MSSILLVLAGSLVGAVLMGAVVLAVRIWRGGNMDRAVMIKLQSLDLLQIGCLGVVVGVLILLVASAQLVGYEALRWRVDDARDRAYNLQKKSKKMQADLDAIKQRPASSGDNRPTAQEVRDLQTSMDNLLELQCAKEPIPASTIASVLPADAPVPVPTSIEGFVSNEAVAEAVTKFEDNANDGPDFKWYDVGVDVTYSQREVFYLSWASRSLEEGDIYLWYMADHSPRDFRSAQTWRQLTLAFLKTELKDPAKLKSVYLRYKPIIVSSAPSGLRSQVETITLVFRQPVSAEIREAHLKASRSWVMIDRTPYQNPCHEIRRKGWAEDMQDLRYRSNQEEAFKDHLGELQFRLRREAEGGQALVDAYAWILTDLRDALPEAP